MVKPADVVFPMVLQSPSAPPLLLPSPLARFPKFTLMISIGQLLAGPPQELPHLVPLLKHLLILATVLGLVSALLSVSVPFFVLVLPFERNIYGFKKKKL